MKWAYLILTSTWGSRYDLIWKRMEICNLSFLCKTLKMHLHSWLNSYISQDFYISYTKLSLILYTYPFESFIKPALAISSSSHFLSPHKNRETKIVYSTLMCTRLCVSSCCSKGCCFIILWDFKLSKCMNWLTFTAIL